MLFQGPIVLMLAVVLVILGVCWWFWIPGPDEYELPTVYTADNLRLGGMYDVTQGRCIQAFVVKNIRDGLFFIHVVPDDPKKDPEIIG